MFLIKNFEKEINDAQQYWDNLMATMVIGKESTLEDHISNINSNFINVINNFITHIYLFTKPSVTINFLSDGTI